MAKRRKKGNSTIITALMYVLIGVLCCIFGGGMIEWLLIVGGILFILFGALEIIRKNTLAGVLSIIIGIVLIVGRWAIPTVIMLVFGILIAIKGIISLVEALKRRSTLDTVFAVLTMVAGFLLAFGNAGDIIIRIAGIVLAFNGILELAGKGFSKK